MLPSPGHAGRGPYRLDGERDAVAGVYLAVVALLEAVGGPDAVSRRAALATALDQAQEALSGPRLRVRASSAAERRLHLRYEATLPLAEAATALAWAGVPLPARALDGPRRLAVAVRAGRPCGALPAPPRNDDGLRALDDALLHAAEAFDSRTGRAPGRRRVRSVVASLLRGACGPAGREYGVRVALCCAVSTVVALGLDHDHWYWLPATTVFLVKPDLGPLVSRVVCRALGTVVGAGVFAVLALALTEAGQPAAVAVVGACGALLPVATRHFAAQTVVVTALVLSLVLMYGEPPASGDRIVESLLACATVLVVGHLPLPGQRGHAVRTRLDTATRAAHRYLGHVMDAPQDRVVRWDLRREAYRTLGAARSAIDVSAAELPPLAQHTAGSHDVAAALERLVDTTTACAVHLDGKTQGLSSRHTEQLDAELSAVLDARAAAAGGARTSCGSGAR